MRFKLVLCSSLIFLITSCTLSNNVKIPENTAESSKVISEIQKFNSAKKPCKGITYISIATNNRLRSFKTAFASNGKDKIRLEILSPAGLPALSIAYTGKDIYISENNGKRIKKYSYSNSVTEKILGFPFDLKILSCLLCSKIPIEGYTKSYVNKSEGKTELTLKKKSSSKKIIYSTLSGQKTILVSENKEDKYKIDIDKNKNFFINAVDKNIKISFIMENIMQIKNMNNSDIFMLTR